MKYILLGLLFFILPLAVSCWMISIAIKGEDRLNEAKNDCRKLGGYIETFAKNPNILCWDKEGKVLYFRR